MLIKQNIYLYGTICESVLIEVLKGKPNSKVLKFKQRTEYLKNISWIDQKLEADLNKLWDLRCATHLNGTKELELAKWKMLDLTFARDTLNSFVVALQKQPKQ